MNHKEITALIKKISGQANFIGTPRLYVDIFDGDLVAAVWLNQVVYWDGKNKEPIGFYKTYKEWKDELGLSEFQVRRVAKECEKRGLMNITFRKSYGTPKNHYLVVWPELLKTINSTLEKPDPEETEGSETQGSEVAETQGSMEGKETSPSLTEIEIPTESELTEKELIIEALTLPAVTLFPKDYRKWELLEKKIRAAQTAIQDGVLIISGLGIEAAYLEERYALSFNRQLVVNKIGGFTSLTFQE